jgi:hypothetical protein
MRAHRYGIRDVEILQNIKNNLTKYKEKLKSLRKQPIKGEIGLELSPSSSFEMEQISWKNTLIGNKQIYMFSSALNNIE